MPLLMERSNENMPLASLNAVRKQRLKRCIIEASVDPKQSACAK